MCAESVRAGARELVEALGTMRCNELTPLLDGFSTLEAFHGPKAQLLVVVLSLIICSDGDLI